MNSYNALHSVHKKTLLENERLHIVIDIAKKALKEIAKPDRISAVSPQQVASSALLRMGVG